ncbi:MAG: DNA-protecting protein DprA [Alphaproteobacteria bacterium]|nr:DNA-protecting protein DprA [Alphaproteobacteria bacterium]
MNDLLNKLLLLRSPGIGPVKFNELIKKFNGLESAVDALNPSDELRDSIKREMDRANELNIHYVCDDDELYPVNLRLIKNHPPVISARGNIETLKKRIVSMVGTRHATAAGMGFVADMANGFVDNGFAVASGMAIGTDTAAHMGALRSDGNANTIAVLAGGVDYVWPLENEKLYYEILERGVVISEMPVGYIPKTTNFIQRNHWVAGICESLILGEADMKSGSMATARFALNYDRPVYAIPSHPSDARSIGPNSLIASGDAKICCGLSDFFEAPNTKNNIRKKVQGNESENAILDALGMIPVSESVLAQIVKKTVSEIKQILIVLELRGLVRKDNGGYVRV